MSTAKRVSFTLPTPNRTAPKLKAAYWTINIDKSAPKLNSFAILSRVWSGSKTDERRLRYNNVFSSLGSAKAARAEALKGFANNR